MSARAVFLSGILAFAVGFLPASAQDIPPYPHALPAWYENQLQCLERKVNVDLHDTPLTDVLAFLRRFVGIDISLDAPGFDESAARVTLCVTELEAGSTLYLVASMQQMTVCHRDGAIVVTNRPDKYPAPPSAEIRARIEAVRKRALAPVDVPVDANLAVAKTLAERTVTIDFDDTPLMDAVVLLRERSSLKIVVEHDVMAEEPVVSAHLEGGTLDVALEAMLKPKGFGHYLEHGVVFVAKAEKAKDMMEKYAATRAAALAITRRIEKLSATVIDLELAGKRPDELPALLAGPLGAEVVIGPLAWVHGRAIAGKSAGKTLAEVATALAAEGYLLVITPDSVYLLEN